MNLSQSDFDKIILLKKDYLLLKRILYKTKSLYKRHRHYQKLNKLSKLLKKIFKLGKKIKKKEEKEKEKEKENKSFKYELSLDKNDLNYCIDIIIELGGIINNMLKLKLYLSYSLIILGIISRLYFIINYFLKKIN